jgi:Ca2+-binding EF-hand superfamily protein
MPRPPPAIPAAHSQEEKDAMATLGVGQPPRDHIPGIPAMTAKGMSEWRPQWRASIFNSIEQQELVKKAALMPPSRRKTTNRGLPKTEMQSGIETAEIVVAREKLRRLGELNSMREEDDRGKLMREERNRTESRRILFNAGATAAEERSMAVGDPRWRRRIQHLMAFAERHGLSLRRCFEVAQELRHRENDAIEFEAAKERRKQLMWGGGQQLLQYDGKSDPASRMRELDALLSTVQVMELPAFCVILGIPQPSAQDKQLFDLFDNRGLGLVDLQGFLLVLLHCSTASDREKYRLIFFIIDRDQNGTLDIGELQIILKCNWQASDWEIEKKARAILAASDDDGSGDLDFNEFCEYCDENPDVFLPEYIRKVNEKKKKTQQNKQRAILLEGVASPALMAKSKGKKKKGGGGSRGRGRSSRPRGRGRGQQRLKPISLYAPDLGVRKAIELAQTHADALHVPLPPFQHMVNDQSIMGWQMNFSFRPDGTPMVEMSKGRRPGTGSTRPGTGMSRPGTGHSRVSMR